MHKFFTRVRNFNWEQAIFVAITVAVSIAIYYVTPSSVRMHVLLGESFVLCIMIACYLHREHKKERHVDEIEGEEDENLDTHERREEKEQQNRHGSKIRRWWPHGVALAATLFVYTFISPTLAIICALMWIFFCSPWGARCVGRFIYRVRTNNNTLILPFYALAFAVLIAHVTICRGSIAHIISAAITSSTVSEDDDDRDKLLDSILKEGTTDHQGQENPHPAKGCLWFFLISVSVFPTAFVYNIWALRDELGDMVRRAERRFLERRSAEENLPNLQTGQPAEKKSLTVIQGIPSPGGNRSWGETPITRKDFFSFEMLELIINIAREFFNLSIHNGTSNWRPKE